MTTRFLLSVVAFFASCTPLAAQNRTAESINLKNISLSSLSAPIYSNPDNADASVGSVTVYGTYTSTANGIEFGDNQSYSSFSYITGKDNNGKDADARKTAWIYIGKGDKKEYRFLPIEGCYIKVTVNQPCKVYVTTSVGGMASLIVMEDDRILYNRNTTPNFPSSTATPQSSLEFALFYGRPGHTYYLIPFFGNNPAETQINVQQITFVTKDSENDPSLDDFLAGKVDFSKLVYGSLYADNNLDYYNRYLHYNPLQWPIILGRSGSTRGFTIPRMGFTLPDVSVAIGGYLARKAYRLGYRYENKNDVQTDNFNGKAYSYTLETAGNTKYVTVSSSLGNSLYTENKDNNYFIRPGQGDSYFTRPIQGPHYIVEAFTPRRVTLTGYAQAGLGIFLTDEMGRPIAADSTEKPVVTNATYDDEKKVYIAENTGNSLNISTNNTYEVKVTFTALPGKTYFVGGDDFEASTPDARNKGMFHLSGVEQALTDPENIRIESTPLVLDGSSYTPATVPTYYPTATITKKLTSNQWNTIVLPFSMTERQVNTTFGDNTQIIALDSMERQTPRIDAEGNPIKPYKMHQKYHYYQFIPAGCPVLIKPTFNTAANAPSETKNQFTIDNGVTLVPGQDRVQEWGSSEAVCTGTFTTIESSRMPVSENTPIYFLSTKDRIIKKRTTPITLPAFSMIYLYKGMEAFMKGTAAPSGDMEFAMEDPELLLDDLTTGITDTEMPTHLPTARSGVYNIMGQKVADSTEQLSLLPKGIYIVNGQKIMKP